MGRKGASETPLNIRVWVTHHRQPDVPGWGLANLSEKGGFGWPHVH